MDAEMFAEIDPAGLIFYIYHQSLFLIDPVWENFNCLFKWMSIDSADLKRTLDSDQPESARNHYITMMKSKIELNLV